MYTPSGFLYFSIVVGLPGPNTDSQVFFTLDINLTMHCHSSSTDGFSDSKLPNQIGLNVPCSPPCIFGNCWSMPRSTVEHSLVREVFN